MTLSLEAFISSREIAELCEKEHRNVTRDIRTMLEELGEAENPDLLSQYQGVCGNGVHPSTERTDIQLLRCGQASRHVTTV
nr:Rha family transcriptional regulator [Pantoea sp. A4]